MSADTFDRRIVTLLAFGPGLAMIALIAVSGRGTFAMWGYPLWLFVGLWIVLMVRAALDRARLAHAVAHWVAVFAIFAIVFVVNYSVLPLIDHRYRAVFYPGDTLAAALTQRFHDATGTKLRYVVGAMWDGGNLAIIRRTSPRFWSTACRAARRGSILPTCVSMGPSWYGAAATPSTCRRNTQRRRQSRSGHAVRSADAPWRRHPACRLGGPEAAVRIHLSPPRGERSSEPTGPARSGRPDDRLRERG